MEIRNLQDYEKALLDWNFWADIAECPDTREEFDEAVFVMESIKEALEKFEASNMNSTVKGVG